MLKRTLSPRFIRAAAKGAGEVMRVDIHPADFDQPSHVATLEQILDQARAQGRTAVTYDNLSLSQGAAAGVRPMPIA
jgi:DNA-binding protein YbaB